MLQSCKLLEIESPKTNLSPVHSLNDKLSNSMYFIRLSELAATSLKFTTLFYSFHYSTTLTHYAPTHILSPFINASVAKPTPFHKTLLNPKP